MTYKPPKKLELKNPHEFEKWRERSWFQFVRDIEERYKDISTGRCRNAGGRKDLTK